MKNINNLAIAVNNFTTCFNGRKMGHIAESGVKYGIATIVVEPELKVELEDVEELANFIARISSVKVESVELVPSRKYIADDIIVKFC